MHKRYQKSIALWEKSKNSIVPGSSVISKDPRLYPFGTFPIYLQSAQGAYVTDVDGNKYIDFQGCLGASILGASHKAVNDAIEKQLNNGTLFSLFNPDAITLAEKICSLIPCAERIRILKSGSDANSGAIRIARAYTGRTKIASCHFHGWHDWSFVNKSLNRGIPRDLKKDTIEFCYNDILSLERVFNNHPNQIAAVSMEAVHCEAPESDYLKAVKELTHKHGALLIFDEVVTGFRFSLGGAQQYFGITPDLACFGKALSNGMPLAILAGKKEIMDSTQDVITTTTHNEECLSIVAGIATLNELEATETLSRIWKLGAYFKEKYNRYAQEFEIPTKCIGYPARLFLIFDSHHDISAERLKSLFYQELAARGVLFGNVNFITGSHTQEHIERTLFACREVLQELESSAAGYHGYVAKDLWKELFS